MTGARIMGDQIIENRIRVGALSFGYQDGALRHIRLGDVEILRGIAFLVRDRDWGTLVPQISGETQDLGDAVTIRYRATYASQGADLIVDVQITAGPQGLDFTAKARALGRFETNRAGFTVLHPITGVAGAPVTVEHCDGHRAEAHFPDLIAPWQPFMDLRALTHQAGNWRVTCRMEGDTFEMEDQRQWGDASFKTYVRPLALPWPYDIADGAGFDQAVRLQWQPVVAARAVTPVAAAALPRLAQTALVITADEAVRAATRPDDLAVVAPQRLLCHFDATRHGQRQLEAFAALQAHYPAAYDLELIARCDGDLEAEFADHAHGIAQAGLTLASIMVCPSVDRGSTPPGSIWPPCPPLAQVHHAARAAFPSMVMGGGMASFFPELNRKRPPVDQLDFVTHGLCPIVHDAGDHAVMETLEAVPHITRSARAIIGAKDYRIGPCTLAMRQNPYGARPIPNPHGGKVCMTDDDPRHRSDFGARYAVALAAALVPAGVTVWTPAGLYGPRGVMDADGRPYPVAHVLAQLAGAAGQSVTRADLHPNDHVHLSVGNLDLHASLR